MADGAYRRRVTSEEAREGYVFVLKNRLAFFPTVGTPFTLVSGGASCRARVEARDCTCRGPARPHEHTFIRWPGLEAGQRVAIARDADKPGRYHLSVESAEPGRRGGGGGARRR
jgi:hypothetical protein